MGFDDDSARPAAVDEDDEPTRGTIAKDPELVALTRIGRMLDALNEIERTRVARYVAAKYLGIE